jgi:hypothetical protein
MIEDRFELQGLVHRVHGPFLIEFFGFIHGTNDASLVLLPNYTPDSDCSLFLRMLSSNSRTQGRSHSLHVL